MLLLTSSMAASGAFVLTRNPKVKSPMLCLCVCCVCVVGHLSERRLHVYPGAHILVAQEAGVSGQGIVGKNGVIVRGTGARRVLARRGVLLEGRRQVQVLRGEEVQKLETWRCHCGGRKNYLIRTDTLVTLAVNSRGN